MEWAIEILRSGLVGVIGFIAVLALVIFVHEYGHFIVGRWAGVKIEAFSIGFGKEIWSRVDKHGTLWRIALIPLGGYVRFSGDASADSTPDYEAVAAMSDEDRRRSLPAQPVYIRSAIIAAGPFANFIFSFIVFTLLAWFTGTAQPASFIVPLKGPITLADGSEKVTTPAEDAGLQAGDRIVAIDGNSVALFSEIVDYMMKFEGDTITLDVKRDEKTFVTTITPVLIQNPDGTPSAFKKLAVGVAGIPEESTRTYPSFLESLRGGALMIWRIISVNLGYLSDIIVGKESGDQLMGPVGITTQVFETANQGITPLIYLTAFLSVAIGFINLFPVVPLDGGHLLFNLIEAIRRKPLGQKAQEAAFWVGIVFVASLMGFATFNDISRLVVGVVGLE